MKKLIILGCVIFMVTSCSFAPKYERPLMPVPEHFKETGKWVPAKTVIPSSKITPWWEVYNDPVLNKLESLIEVSNQDLKKYFIAIKKRLH